MGDWREKIESTPRSQEYLNEYRGDNLIAIAIAFALLPTLTLALRFYSKRFKGAHIGIDDAFIFAAYLVNLSLCAMGLCLVVYGGVGHHVEVVERQDPAALLCWAKLVFAFQVVFFLCVALPKAAIILLYLRVFAWRGPMRMTAHALLFAIAASTIGLMITSCVQCRPLAYWWDSSIPGGTCINVQLFYHLQALPGIILDLAIMALPVRTVWALKMPLRTRSALMGIFLIGSFGIVASIIRAATFFNTAAFTDRTWASVELIGWSLIETGTYIVAACLPHLRPLFAHWMPRWIKDKVRRNAGALTSGSLTKAASRGSRPLPVPAGAGACRVCGGGRSGSLASSASSGYVPGSRDTAPGEARSPSGDADEEALLDVPEKRGTVHYSRPRPPPPPPERLARERSQDAVGQIQVTTEIKMERHDAARTKGYI